MRYAQSESTTSVPLWREAVGFSAAHWTAIIKVLLPPTMIAYLSALALEYQIDLIRAQIMPGSFSVLTSRGLGAYERLMMPMQPLFILKQWFIWSCYCFAMIGVCNLVRDLTEEGHPSSTSVFSTIRDRPVRFVIAATLFFGLLMLGFVGMIFIAIGIDLIQSRAHIPYARWENWMISFTAMAAVSAVIVRWAFVVPLSVLNDLPFAAAMRASDRLTNYRMLPLWALVMESEVTGYLALIAPSYALFYLHLPPTVFTYYSGEAVALLLSAMTQAPLMVGIALVLQQSQD